MKLIRFLRVIFASFTETKFSFAYLLFLISIAIFIGLPICFCLENESIGIKILDILDERGVFVSIILLCFFIGILYYFISTIFSLVFCPFIYPDFNSSSKSDYDGEWDQVFNFNSRILHFGILYGLSFGLIKVIIAEFVNSEQFHIYHSIVFILLITISLFFCIYFRKVIFISFSLISILKIDVILIFFTALFSFSNPDKFDRLNGILIFGDLTSCTLFFYLLHLFDIWYNEQKKIGVFYKGIKKNELVDDLMDWVANKWHLLWKRNKKDSY